MTICRFQSTIRVSVPKNWILKIIPGWYLTRVAIRAENLWNQTVVINVCCCVTRDPVLHVHKLYQRLAYVVHPIRNLCVAHKRLGDVRPRLVWLTENSVFSFFRNSFFYSANWNWNVEFMFVDWYVMIRANVHHVRRRASNLVCVATVYRNVIAIAWSGNVRRTVINYIRAEFTVASWNVISEIVVIVHLDCPENAHVGSRYDFDFLFTLDVRLWNLLAVSNYSL